MATAKRFYVQNKVHDWLEGRDKGVIVTTEDAAKGLVREQPEFMAEAYEYWQEQKPYHEGVPLTFERWFGRNVQRAMKTADRDNIVSQVGPMRRRLKTAYQIIGEPFKMSEQLHGGQAGFDEALKIADSVFGRLPMAGQQVIGHLPEPADSAAPVLGEQNLGGVFQESAPITQTITTKRTITFEVLADIEGGGYLLRGQDETLFKAMVV